eukprot:1144916-Pelagomonas_calceolata.AAC.8
MVLGHRSCHMIVVIKRGHTWQQKNRQKGRPGWWCGCWLVAYRKLECGARSSVDWQVSPSAISCMAER